MKHQNIINFLSGSMWLSTESQMDAVRAVTESVLNSNNGDVRAKFLEKTGEAGTGGGGGSLYEQAGVVLKGSTAIVPLHGAIAPKVNAMSAISGGTSAELFTTTIKALTDDTAIKSIVLDVDSGGGNVHGIQAAANAVLEARKTKRVVTLANYDMCSAAYWIGSAAEKVFVTPTSNVGSIGVLSVLQFNSEEDQKRVEIIRSAPNKAAVNPHEPLTDEARKKLQTDIDRMHVSFVEAISLNRNISMDKANELADGSVEMGEAAVEAGLADGTVEGLDDVLATIDAMDDMDGRIGVLRESYISATEEVKVLAAEIVDYETRLDEAQAVIAGLETVMANQKADSAKANFEAVLDDAIESGRIPAGLRAEWIADYDAGDVSISAFSRMVGNISAGTVVPTDSLTPDVEASATDPLKPSNELERNLFAQFGLATE
jgi:signal peptide peptidase SppA